MGGFLGGLGTLLGGFNVARRIDDEGFDFREKQAQEEWERQRKQELALQADQDRAAQIGAQIALGTPEGQDPDFAGLDFGIPQRVAAQRIEGMVAGTKPAIEAQKAYNRRLLEGTKQEGRAELVGLRGTEAQELENLRHKNRAIMTPEESRRLDVLERMAGASETRAGAAAARAASGVGGAGRIYWRKNFNPETGMVEDMPVTPEMAQGMIAGTVPRPARFGQTVENRIKAASDSQELGGRLLGLLDQPENLERVGIAMGNYNSLMDAAGAGDPIAGELAGELMGLSALQPAIHGFRAVRFQEEINDMLHGRQDPGTLRAKIRGILAASHVVAGDELPPFAPERERGAEMEGLAEALAGLSDEEIRAVLGIGGQ